MHIYLQARGVKRERNLLVKPGQNIIRLHTSQDVHCSGGHTDYYKLTGEYHGSSPIYRWYKKTEARRENITIEEYLSRCRDIQSIH